MSHSLLLCRQLGQARPMGAKQFGDIFDGDDTAFRAAFIAVNTDKPVLFEYDGHKHIVLRFHEQAVNHMGSHMLPMAIKESEFLTKLDQPAHDYSSDPPALPAPEPEEELSVWRLKILGPRLETEVRLKAHSEEEARLRFHREFPRLKRPVRDGLRDALERCIHDNLLHVDDFEIGDGMRTRDDPHSAI